MIKSKTIKSKTRTINFLEGNLKDIKLKDLIEEKKIFKNGDVKLTLFYGIAFKNQFYLCEKIIKSFLKEKIKYS